MSPHTGIHLVVFMRAGKQNEREETDINQVNGVFGERDSEKALKLLHCILFTVWMRLA